jgi:hypothetical protein
MSAGPRAKTDVVLALSAGGLGVFAGAMLTEAGVLVPYWRALPPAEFFAWYAANDARLLGFFGPLTAVAVLVAIAAAAMAVWTAHPGRRPAVVAAVLSAAALSTFFVYFRAANASFSAGTAELPAELDRWAAWHWARTVVSCAALAAGFMALKPGSRAVSSGT